MKDILYERNVPDFLGKLIHWCYRWGCEVRLRNLHFQTPYGRNQFSVGDRHEYDRDGSIIDLDQVFKTKQVEIPEIIFTRGDKNIKVNAMNWDELMIMLEHRYKIIFMELSVPMFDPFDGKGEK